LPKTKENPVERVMKRVGLVLAALTIALLFVSCEFAR